MDKVEYVYLVIAVLKEKYGLIQVVFQEKFMPLRVVLKEV
jgi:hypothetical protein